MLVMMVMSFGNSQTSEYQNGRIFASFFMLVLPMGGQNEMSLTPLQMGGCNKL